MKGGGGVVLVVAGLLLGCLGDARSGGPGAQEAVSRADSAGVEIVTNDSTTVALALVEELRIGVVEGDPRYQLHRVADVDVGRDGTVVLFNEGSLSLRFYDGGGRFRREIGREGEGPGEFRGGRTAQYSLRIWGDTIVVAEWLGRAVTFTAFDTTGALLHTARGVDSPWFFRDETMVPRGDGRLRFTTSTMPQGRWDVADERKQTHLVVREIDLTSGEIGGELTRVPGRIVLSSGRGMPYPVGLPFFEPSPLAAVVPDGILTTRADDYEVRLLAPDSMPVRIVRRRYEPRPVTDEIRAGLEESPASRGPAGERLLARTPRVETFPPIDALATTREGGFWLRRKDLTDDPVADMRRAFLAFDGADPMPERWEGFAPNGAYLGTAQLPERFTPHAWGADWVVGVVEDELDVEYVVVLAIREPAAG